MATLTATVTLSSAAGQVGTDALSFSVATALTTADGGPSRGISKQTITTAENQELVDEGTAGVYYF